MSLNSLKIIVFFFFCTSFVCATDQVAEIELFSKNITVEINNEDINLIRTGSTVRKKYFFRIYKMAHYVDATYKFPSTREEIYNTILQQNCVKQISTVYLRSIKAEQIRKSLASDFKLNTNENEYLEMLPQINAFMDVINQDINENDEFILRRFPDGTIISVFQGKVISTIKDENFARTLWSIWFGRFSVVKRDTLVKELLTSS